MQENKKFALKKLSALKERLLDLTARNRMINSNFNARTKQHFRIIDEVPQQIYDKLSNSSMVFNPLLPVEDEPRDENRAVFKEKLRKAQHTDLDYQERLNEFWDILLFTFCCLLCLAWFVPYLLRGLAT